MTHFTAFQLGHALLKMFKAGQKKILYEVSNFIKRNPDIVINKVSKYIKKQSEIQPQESKPKSELHLNLGRYYPALNSAQEIIEQPNMQPEAGHSNEHLRYQNQRMRDLCTRMIDERKSELKQHLVKFADSRRKQIDDLTMSFMQLQDRFRSIEIQWAETSLGMVAITDLNKELQRRNEIICQAYISKRDLELSQPEGAILIDKVYQCIEDKIYGIEEKFHQIDNKVEMFIKAGGIDPRKFIPENYFM